MCVRLRSTRAVPETDEESVLPPHCQPLSILPFMRHFRVNFHYDIIIIIITVMLYIAEAPLMTSWTRTMATLSLGILRGLRRGIRIDEYCFA